VGIGDGTTEPMIGFPPIEGTVDLSSQQWRVHVIQQIQAADDVFEFPQSLFRAILSPMATQFGHNHTL